MGYIDKLIENCILARDVKPTREFVFNKLEELENIKNAVYVIEDLSRETEKTFLDFSRYKALKERKCAKLNSPSNILYVGSSTTDLKKESNSIKVMVIMLRTLYTCGIGFMGNIRLH